MNQQTIQYWHKLEHFYPYILEEQRNEHIKTYNIKKASDFPDFTALDLKSSHEVRYYDVYLGLFKVDSALNVLSHKLNINNHFHDEDESISCFCNFRLDSSGQFDQTSFKVSSFPWAIQRVNDNGIYIEEWDASFHCFQREIFLKFFDTKNEITYEVLKSILIDIASEISWQIEFDNCWMRIDRVTGEKKNIHTPIEKATEIDEENEKIDELIKANNLLNSFYVRDIEKINNAIIQGNYGPALNDYIDHNNDKYLNVETDEDLLFSIFNPKNMPMGKWPSGYPLRAMQQVAVNISMSETLQQGNIFSVNGPPGTGKTTLLRDIIAANVVKRAEKLIQFNTPNDAFTDIVDSIEYKGYTNKVRKLDESLNSYGILVASNNNAAVKNITTELPLLNSITKDYRAKYCYFSEVSDLRLQPQKTWGLCAAELGNRRNCNRFIDAFWPLKKENCDEFNLNHYLTKTSKKTADCITNWQKAKIQFIKKYNEVEQEYHDIQKCYDAIATESELISQLCNHESEYSRLFFHKLKLDDEILHTQAEINTLTLRIEQKQAQKKAVRHNITFFTIKYFFKYGVNDYLSLEQDILKLLTEKRKLEDMITEKKLEIQTTEKKINNYQEQLDNIKNKLKKNRQFIHNWEQQHDCNIPISEYILSLKNSSDEEHEVTQAQSPWDYKKIIQLREELFLEAMQLHKAFVENSSYMRDQLDAFGKLLRNQLPTDKAEKCTTPLIQSFQLMVPVISTTFASVGTFLKNAVPNTFGLLLIDEAGQALPQSAIGAIWRSKKCIVVGDPLQIEPVVTVHDKTIEFLRKVFSQTEFISSKDTSVQSLADRCNPYGAFRENEISQFWVGSPLLVHGRCQKRIFDIANQIAYNEKMIYGTKNCAHSVCAWVHVVGNATYKHFVEQQANALLPLVVAYFQVAWKNKKDSPSLFIITPFRSVKTKLIEYLIEKDTLYNNLLICNEREGLNEPADATKKITAWGYSNIGTIHTFQGKEASTVILCLGADSGNKNDGAIQWASAKPNILNVAVTRAKDNLYIVGDANKWGKQPYFETAYKICEKIKA